MNNQKNFTDKVNELILYGKSQGLSTNDISDKWHTFGELYHHRMILTLALMRQNLDKAWKSKKHHDGTMFEDSFICGIDTPKGQYSYHYDLEHWELFNVKELDKAPEYDGHKPEDVTRLLSLTVQGEHRHKPLQTPKYTPPVGSIWKHRVGNIYIISDHVYIESNA